MSPPFVDAIRTAHANANKEFDTFYEYVSKVMTPRRSEHQSNNTTIYKSESQSTKRTRQELDARHGQKSISSMTPIGRSKTPHDDASYMKQTPTQGRRRYKQQQHRPSPVTSNTMRSYSDLDSDQGPTNVYLRTPHRSVDNTKHSSFRYSTSTPSAATPTCSDLGSCLPTTPSIVLQDHLQEESRRLDQLHHNVRIVQQQSLALARFHSAGSFTNSSSSSSSNSDAHLNRPHSYLPRYLPYSTRRRQLVQPDQKKYTPRHASATSQTDLPVFTTSTPLASPAMSHQPLNECQEHPLFTAPTSQQLLPPSSSSPAASASGSKNASSTQLPSRRSSSPVRGTSPSSARSSDNPKTQPPTCNITTVPERNSNAFRTQAGNKPLSPLATNDSFMSTSFTSTTRKRTQQPSYMDEKEDWMDAMGNGLEDDHFDRHAKTLDQELGLANDKFNALQRQQQQQHIESKAFSLRPSDSPLFMEEEEQGKLQHGTIDGDRWTFAGQHYTVHEKQ